ncbi:MAG: T9SS type A sorting domain-containing protein [Bacteroidales bacterium]
MWISSGGRGDDKAFVAGTEYKFNVALNGQNDLVTLETLIGLNDIVTPTFGVYPNPAIDFVTISDANGSEIRIVDMLGRTLVSKVSTSNTETVSLNNLQSGMYMIQIIKDGKASTQKLIKR